jgi:hypothetical protein
LSSMADSCASEWQKTATGWLFIISLCKIQDDKSVPQAPASP